MFPKKSLGQNFLNSEGALNAMIEAGDVMEDDVILEVGPGKGALTKKLLSSSGKVVAIEKDHRLIPLLEETFSKEIKEGKLDLLESDVLEFDPETISSYGSSYKVIANIPYYITGQFIRKFLSAKHQPERIVVLLQKEVATRIIAKDKKESILSISVKAYGEPIYIQTVKSGSFFPAPSVDSAILLIQNISKKRFEDFSEEDFFRMVKAGFASKRKKLSGNLSNEFPKELVLKAFAALGLDENTRAEDIDISVWEKLGKEILKA